MQEGMDDAQERSFPEFTLCQVSSGNPGRREEPIDSGSRMAPPSQGPFYSFWGRLRKRLGYSALSATAGSTAAARRAGSHAEKNVSTTRQSPALAIDSGSIGDTW